MNGYLFAVIQGVVEGLTEFLPVSSTGHLILSGYLLSSTREAANFTEEAAKSFEIFIQLGAILAVAVLYRGKLFDMLRRWKERPGAGKNRLTLWHLAVAMLPAVVLGLLLHHAIKTYLFSPWTVLIGLVVGGIFMIVADKVKKPVTAPTVDAFTVPQALGVGLFQCLSLWPGFSRAGATIAGALLLGASYRAAAEFSFLLAVPVMIAATGLDLVKSRELLGRSNIGPFLVGFVVAFIVAWVAVVGFLRLLQRWKLTPFAIYRFVVAALFALYLFRRS